MAAENFKVKKGLEVGTGTTINATGINVTGVVTATQIVGDGSGLTNVVGSGSGVVVKDEGSAVGTAGTINFVGSGVAATLSAGIATITIDSGGLSDIVSDTTPQLGGSLDLNSKDITGSGDIDITGNLNISGISTFDGNINLVRPGSSNHNILKPNFTTFDIIDTTHGAQLRLRGGSPTLIFDRSGTGSAELYFDDNGFKIFKGQPVGGSTEVVSITNDGNVGINSIAPTSKLDVDGDIKVSGVSTFTNEIVISDDSPTITFDQTSGSLSNNQYRIRQGSGELIVQVSSNNGASYTNGVSIGGIGNIFIPDNDKVFFGTDDDAYIQHDNSNLNVINTTGNIDVTGNVVLNNNLNLGTGVTANSSGINVTGIITATSFSGLLVGNVQGNVTGNTSGSSGSCTGNAATATEATNVTVTANNSTNETVYPVFVDGATGTQGAETDTGLNYNPSTGNLSATKFTGDGSGLTSIPSAQLTGALPALDGSALTNIAGSGSGIIIRHDGNVVGTASSINFSTNLDVTPISAGIVTVTASGGGSGITTANVVTDSLVVSGVSTLSGNCSFAGNNVTMNTSGSPSLNVGGTSRFEIASIENALLDGSISHTGDTTTQIKFETSTIKLDTAGTTRLNINNSGVTVTGIATATTFSGSGASLTTLNASELDSGTIPNGRFPTTLPAVSGANLTNLPAANLSGTISDARISDIGDSEARIITLDNLEKSNLSADGQLSFDSSQGLLVYRSQQGTTGGVTVLDGANVDAGTGISITNLGTGSEGTTSFEFSIADNGVTFDKLEDVANNRILGRVSSGSGNAEELTATQVRTLLNVADGATAGITTAASNVQVSFEILSTSSNSNGYRFSGPGNDGADPNPDLYLVRGQRYRFIQNAGSHPFEIQSTAGGSAYNTGVENNGASSGNIDFNVQHDAPTRLYYQCTSHGGMIGNIYITGGASWQTTDVNTSTTEEIFTNLNVGIGTDDPESRLTIFERVANSDGVKTLLSLISDKNDMTTGTRSGGAIRFLNQDDNNSAQALIQVNDPSSYTGDNEGLRERTVDFNFKQSSGGLSSLITSLTIKGETGNVGVGSDAPTQKLDVDGTIRFGTSNASNISSRNQTYSNFTGSAVTLDDTAVGSCSAIEYTIFISNSGNIQSQKVLIMDDGIDAYIQVFAMMINANLIATFSADVNSGNVRLRATPETGISGSTTIKFSKLIIE